MESRKRFMGSRKRFKWYLSMTLLIPENRRRGVTNLPHQDMWTPNPWSIHRQETVKINIFTPPYVYDN